MASRDRDQVDGDLQSSLVDNDTDLFASTNLPFINENIDPDDSLSRKDEENEEVLARSTVINAPESSLRISESGSQYDDRQTYQPILGSKDKGKTPVRVSLDTSDRSLPDNERVPDGNLQLQAHATSPPSITENLDPPGLPVTPGIEAVNKEGFDGSLLENCNQQRTRSSSPESTAKIFDVESEEKSCSALSPKPHINNNQSHKQILKSEQKSGPEPTKSTSTITDSNANEGSESQLFRPPQYGEPGWEKSAGRPPKKLPIRFKDALGRNYVFPWEKAKNWAGMECLIRTCFHHVPNPVASHVNAGHYDLLTTSLLSSISTGIGLETGPAVLPAVGEPSNENPPPQTPTPPPVAPSVFTQQEPANIILPELWEDLVEPGMSIFMQMWPMDLQPLPPPPPHTGPPPFPLFVGGRGRGRGGGRGMPLPPRPPGWTIIDPPKPKGKTRKRQDGL
ncbi:uncharacterized protein GGS22DRAFT_161510 [Annulohypoxylon maeteangense]|uniref:uncharacterized protein n=1 Tax=Annulohypoxylon maeteangense TaxID=1927788 RepID=UPI002007B6CE|nr:uncharacterized protein GGS22DRAFT_161510 [Annulohypoxylon maeteangense]KAI0885649.1 hypothetical protein GGS22DRAFT_161510 [Annulohypoxylon maeteangense]